MFPVTGFALFGETTCFDLVTQWLMQEPMGKGSLERLNDLEVMQFTGLKDRNDGEIYEGDVVRRYSKSDSKEKPLVEPLVMQVYWNENGCGWSLESKAWTMALSNLCIIEVIGNIYSNPELCGESK
mgnify:FL=1